MFALTPNELNALDRIVNTLYDFFLHDTPIPLTVSRETGDVNLDIPAIIGEHEAIDLDRLYIDVICTSANEFAQHDRHELVMGYTMGACDARAFLAVADSDAHDKPVRRISETLLVDSDCDRGKLYAAYQLLSAEPETPDANGLAKAAGDLEISAINQDTVAYRHWEWDENPAGYRFTITTVD